MQLTAVARAIVAQAGIAIEPGSARAQAGGSINRALKLDSNRGPVFLKVNELAAAAMFNAEVDGLAALARTQALAVPAVLAVGAVSDTAFLLLEYLDLSAGKTDAAARQLGRGLALQHRAAQPAFGWDQDNWIGSSRQPNSPDSDWCRFFCEQRLEHQLNLAEENGFDGVVQRQGAALLQAVPGLLAGHRPPPALLHGDLWGGNWGVVHKGSPYVFDPAVYRGDREADIAMTRLFGGFPPAFYEAYQAAWPLPEGWQLRTQLYNLYHVLNHLNLFGGGYLPQAQAIMRKLLEQVA